MMTTQRHNMGFTLIEMAIVLMIVGLLLGGMLVPLSAQMDQRNSTDTQKSLAEIRDALIGYALANGKLPCPSDPVSSPGIARATCTTAANSSGVLPWVTLGIGGTDAWGNLYTYRVSSDFTDPNGTTFGKDQSGVNCVPSPTPTSASFALCSVGTLDILAAAGGATVASKVPAVVISHGKNGAGAYNSSGSQIPVGSNLDEKANSDGSANLNYVSHTPSTTFDDLVIWIPSNLLLSRMVSAGKLP